MILFLSAVSSGELMALKNTLHEYVPVLYSVPVGASVSARVLLSVGCWFESSEWGRQGYELFGKIALKIQ